MTSSYSTNICDTALRNSPLVKSFFIFYPSFLLTLAVAFFTVLFVTYELNDWYGMYTAFASNLMMSILFINMLIVRSSTRGQSLYVGISKMLGTLVWDIILYRFNSGLTWQ